MIILSQQSYKDTPKKVMVVGKSGTGKTRFAGTFPKPFIASFDGLAGLETIVGHPYAKAEAYEGADGWKAFRKELENWCRNGPQYDCETFVIDSLSMMADCAMDGVRAKLGKLDGSLSQGEWGMLISEIRDVIADAVVRLKCHVLVTAHLQLEKDDLLGSLIWQPLVYGAKLPGQLPAYFSEVYQSKAIVDLKTGNVSYVVQVIPDNKLDFLKSRMNKTQCFAQFEEPDFAKLVAKAQNAKENV